MEGGGPVDLVLVRHGESEGNLAQFRSKSGIEDDWQGPFGERHSSKYRLTDRGRTQAVAAGEYIRKHIYPSFDRCYTSEYARAMETASLLELEHADWFVEFAIRERDNGVLGGLSKKERKEEYSEELERRERDLFYWQPPGGESIAGMCIRVDRFLDMLQKSCAGLRVIVVCHGNIMEGFRILLEKLTQWEWIKLRDSGDPRDKIHNCQILWYSRRDPETNRVRSNIKYMRSICPYDLTKSRFVWEKIETPSFSNQDLQDRVQTIPQLVNRKPEDEDRNSGIEDYIANSFLNIPTHIK